MSEAIKRRNNETDRQTVRERNTDNLCVRHRYRQKVRQTGNESYSEADR